ncbi:MAG: hypothetical protein GF350_05415 [Chitinivibrionales bacterium]|nr:hypothetical protein [Chitinivibrionales bacterium]
MQFISRNNRGPHTIIFVTGLCSIGVQCVFVRESLAVFTGNELVLGFVLSTWLLCSGIGSLIGSKSLRWDPAVLFCLYAWSAIAGMVILRGARLLFEPGEVISPLASLGILSLCQGPFAFVNGYFFGRLSQERERARHLYRYENTGNIAGALLVYAVVLLLPNNALLVGVLLIPLLLLTKKNPRISGIIAAALLVAVMTDSVSSQWKYAMPVEKISYGREGEVARIVEQGDTTWLLNNTVYRSSMDEAFIEQAVHIPMAQRENVRKVLVIFDKGHAKELREYPKASVDILETEKLLAGKESRITSPESYSPDKKYDLIVMGTGLPETMRESRFYTLSFFGRMKSLLSDSGVVSFSLDLSRNYLNRPEQELVHVTHSTLSTVFDEVLIFPGEGYTFMASDFPLHEKPLLKVRTDFVGPYIMPSVTKERFAEANSLPEKSAVSTVSKPVILVVGLHRWLKMIETPLWIFLVILGIIVATGIIFLPKRPSMLSVGTSGFAAGTYSIALMLLYQAGYGALYSRISLLLLSLTLGFALGSFVRTFPVSDIAIGLYVIVSLYVLTAVPLQSQGLFFLFHTGMGFICGAQFVTRKNTETGLLYAVDLFGGVIGMALSSTVLVPMFGVMNVALSLGGVKAVAWGITQLTACFCGSDEEHCGGYFSGKQHDRNYYIGK